MAERDLDDSGLFGEFRRMVRTTGTVGGIAARLAGNRLGIRSGGSAHAEGLKLILGGLKGPLMKAAQLLATIPGALPEEYAEELSQLQANAPPMGWNFIRRRMSGELGADWQTKFRQFSREAASAASLGQVHKAVLTTGETVACKLQYPDMTTSVEADLKQFRMAMGVYQRMDNAIRQEDVVEELTERLREELDYTREAANMRLYDDMLSGRTDVTVPQPIAALSTRRLLTMTWADGRSLKSVLAENPSQEIRNEIAKALFYAWYIPLYHYGVIHGDPHMGNYTVRADNGINLLDFGSIRIFEPTFIKAIIDLCEALRRKDRDMAAEAYRAWGFENLSYETMDVLNEWAEFLYAPALDDRVREIQEGPGGTFGREIMTRVHAGLQRTGGVKPPRAFVLVDRSAIGLGSVFMRIGARLNWCQMFRELTDGFDVTALASRQTEALEKAGIPHLTS
ncbi:AarF/ABC1/UbiB kinase family protein [Acetobacter sp. AN02]|uniref:ABC1 kinase family protein n=1 Tax=Acetobacter sp. AN02 TaxID=2894186 RepID=UPI00243439B7|nr:AarF/ABC1/UbiB kinase family protein [Acetobacter sp. AN02]MDG6093742.1 AarF/ABC1/UbiB kinase family protein [Acetobacter sp. AN02]